MIWYLFIFLQKETASLIPRILSISLTTTWNNINICYVLSTTKNHSQVVICCAVILCVWVHVCSHVWNCIYIFIFMHVEIRVQYLVSSSAYLYFILWDRVSHWTGILMTYLEWLFSKHQGPSCLILQRIQITGVYHHTKCFTLGLIWQGFYWLNYCPTSGYKHFIK